MAALSPTSQDRLFIIGLGVTVPLVIGLMHRLLVQYRDSAVVPLSENKPQYITQDVEDSLKISTLDKLLDSTNYCIQETTATIICERALHDGSTIDVLLWYITRPEHELREKGIRALTMMMNNSTVAMLNKPATYAALVKSLEFSITDYEHNPYDPDWDNWHLRDVVEQGCLLVLSQLSDKFGIEGLVKSRFVERWLAKEPWGTTDEERQINFAESLGEQNRLNELTVPLFRRQMGRKQLVKVKLVPAEFGASSGVATHIKNNGEGTDYFEAMFGDGSRRRRDQSSGDDHIRRRHREAMVLNDGTRPLERGDIIQRREEIVSPRTT